MNQFASALRAPRGGRLPALSVAVLRSVKHRHSSDLRRPTPGALAPVRVIVSRSIITYSAPSAPLAGTPRFRRTRLIRDAHAVRERSSDPRVVPGFRVLFLPLMSSSRTPGSPRQALFQSSRRSTGLRHRGNGSALPTSPPSAPGGGRFSGLPGSLPLRPDRLLASLRRIRPGSAARPIHDPRSYAVSMKCLRQAPSQPAQPQEAFTPRLSAGRSPSLPLGITTAATGILCRWDSHPLEQQLASLHPPNPPSASARLSSGNPSSPCRPSRAAQPGLALSRRSTIRIPWATAGASLREPSELSSLSQADESRRRHHRPHAGPEDPATPHQDRQTTPRSGSLLPELI